MILRKLLDKIVQTAGILLIAATGASIAEEPTKPTDPPAKVVAKPGECLLLIEPKLMAVGVSRPIPDARKTEIVAAKKTVLGMEYYQKEAFEALGLTWEAFENQAFTAAAAHFKTLKPEYFRDARGIVEHVKIFNEHSLTASTILTPEFFALFKDSLGDDLVVAVPDRYHVYVFPRLVSDYQNFGKEILGIYNEALFPVSTEIFMINAKGIRSIGNYKNR